MNREFTLNGIGTDQIGENYFLIGLINRFNNNFQAVADTLFVELSWKQVFFMNCVALFPEAPTIKDMAELLGCSHQNAKQVLSKLETMGYLQIQQDAMDKRKQRILLTKKAIDFRTQYELPSEQAMQRLFSDISEDMVKNMIQTLLQLITNMEQLKGEKDEYNRYL